MHLFKNQFTIILSSFIVLLLSTKLNAQRRMPTIDFESFREAVSSEKSAEKKLQRYVDMSMRIARFYPDSLKAFAEEVQKLSGLNDTEKEGFKNFIMANAWRRGDQDSVIFYGEKAIDNLKQAGAEQEYFFTANLLGTEYSRKREYIKAEAVYHDAIEYSKTANEEYQTTNYLYGNLGSLYAMVGLHDKAIEMFEKFLEKENSPANRCNTISKLSVSLMQINELEKANELLAGCLDRPKLPPPIQATIRSNLSRIVDKMGDDKRSIKLLVDAASISVNNRVANLQITLLIALGNRYLELDEIQKADSIRTLLQRISGRRMRPNFKIDKSAFLADLLLAKGQNEQAIEQANAAIKLADQTGLRYLLKHVHSTKARALENIGEMDEAIESLRQQGELEDLQHDRETEKNLAMMKVRYQLRNKEEQLSEITQELGTVKIRTALIILLIIVTGLYAAYKARMYFLLKEERTRNKIAGDLHDEVSASLSSISYFAEAITRNNPEQKNNKFLNLIMESAGEAKDKITDIIWAINPGQDSWESLLSKCHRYAADLLESKDITYRIDITDQINGKPDLELKQNLWLIFKEILTNAARHSSADRVNISIKESSKTLEIKVEDNGSGFDTSKKNKGNGLKNIFLRVENIGAKVNLHSDKENGTRWELEVPL